MVTYLFTKYYIWSDNLDRDSLGKVAKQHDLGWYNSNVSVCSRVEFNSSIVYCFFLQLGFLNFVFLKQAFVEVLLVLLLGISFVSITDNFQTLATSLTVFFLYVLVVLFFLLG